MFLFTVVFTKQEDMGTRCTYREERCPMAKKRSLEEILPSQLSEEINLDFGLSPAKVSFCFSGQPCGVGS